MTAINSVSNTQTISSTGVNSAASNDNLAASTNDDAVNRVNETRNELLPQDTGDGDVEIADLTRDVLSSEVNLAASKHAVYSSELDYYNAELMGTRGLLSSKESELAALEAKTEIKTEINDKGNAVFTTSGGYQVETDVNQGGHETWIRNPAGETLAHIWGDPHVDLNADGADDFHFGDNSSFILGDGTEIFLNTENVAGTDEAGGYTHSKVFFTTGVYVKAGDNVIQTGDDTKDDGNREAGFRNAEASEMFRGSDADGAALFGLDDQGNAHISNGNDGWNSLQDESWDGYLENASFANQHGGASGFEADHMPSADELQSLRGEIAALEGQESDLVGTTAEFTTLKSGADTDLATASAEYDAALALDDSEFEDTPQMRYELDVKTEGLKQGWNDLQVHLSQSPIVGEEIQGELQNNGAFHDATNGERSAQEKSIEYGLGTYDTPSLTDLDDALGDLEEDENIVAGVIDSIDESNIQGEFAQYATEDSINNSNFTQGLTDMVDSSNNIADLIASGAEDSVIDEAKAGLNEITNNISTEGVTADYSDITKMLDDDPMYFDAEGVPGANNGGAFEGVAGIFIEEAKNDYFIELNEALKDDLSNSLDPANGENLDAASQVDLQVQLDLTNEIIDFWSGHQETTSAIADDVAIDFGDISQEEAEELYGNHLQYDEDMRSYVDEVLGTGEELSDLERVNIGNAGVNQRINDRVISELEEQFGLGNNN
ncbi:MAG: DUF1521 domain-containing protein [Candidatus Caenarcaniphilales bacterium]|nr:DUF1521 domain-containing protein [Candidatus Caenarcaniphilales bacterium]